MPASGNSLVEVLLSQGSIQKEQAERIKLQELQSGKPQEQLLKEAGVVDEVAMSKARAVLYNVPFVDIETLPVNPEALATLQQSIATRFKVYPVAIDRDNNTISVAMGNPLDLTSIQFIERRTGLRVIPLAAAPSQIETFIAEKYTVGLAQEVTQAIKEAEPDVSGVLDLSQLSSVIHESSIAKIVKELLEFAVKSRASDIHVEPQERSTRIRYRIDGILQEKFNMSKQFHDSLVSRIKILGGMKIDEKRMPQDGRFSFKAGADEVDLRVSSLPTVHGEKIVMRLLKKSGGVPELTDLGLRGQGLKDLQDAILRPHGIVIIAGPTGSGKTTTLYSLLHKINTPKVNIVTLEDPVEYQIPGVNQVQINPTAGLTFASGLRSFLRQDPNIIMVGEIRDAETATLAIQAALTGHLVLSTVHTTNAAGVLPRLLDMGAEPFLLSSTITAIVAQRICRKIHDDCKEAYAPDATAITDLKTVLGSLFPKDEKTVQLYKGKGDAECGNTGYKGRVGIYEVMPINEKISKLILEHSDASAIEKQSRENGMITMKQDGYLKAIEGVTSIEEVLRVAQE
ncbi:MAG: GspE/PulE family protein [bacterium]|nr:GspE/PulE family protein [bacterium]